MARTLGILIVALLIAGTWWDRDFWSTPDRRGDRLLRADSFADAAKEYRDPVRQGVALYRAGEFDQASTAFARGSTAEAAYDRGNVLVLRGQYDDAIKSYDRALALKPGWKDATDNRAIAVVRRDRLKLKGGDESGGQVDPDAIVFDKNKPPAGAPTTDVSGGPPLDDEQIRALWMRNVQTRPADFLRTKFAYQMSERSSGGSP